MRYVRVVESERFEAALGRMSVAHFLAGIFSVLVVVFAART